MNDVVERVARAISDAMGEGWREPPYNHLHTDSLNNRARFIARAAIEATGAMEAMKALRRLEAAATLVTEWLDRINDRDGTALGGPQWFELGRAISDARSAMLSEALADSSPDIGKEG